TLVDALLRQSQTELNKKATANDLIMDSNELEKERGITIFSKNASVRWNDVKVNIIDTPGHADFGGEVERVLEMADGCLLVVDAKEGPMPQTRFVLKKALEMKHKIVVIINKIDKPGANPQEALNKTFDLFIDLGADDSTADFPVLYASAKQGKAGNAPDLSTMNDIFPIFDAILQYIPASAGNETAPLQLLVTTIGADDFKGRIATGRIRNGILHAGQEIMHINREGAMKKYRLMSLMTFEGLGRAEAQIAQTGDIVAIAGIPDINIGETIADPTTPVALPVLHIDEPTVKITISINDSPFAGTEGQFSTSRQIRERLFKELETDMALRIEENNTGDWTISGRGELHLAIFIERIRREGYEFQVSRPQVITKKIDGKTMTPYERLWVEVPDAYAGAVIQNLGSRQAEMQRMQSTDGISSLEFIVPTRGLFGYRNEFLTETKGLGIMNSAFEDYKQDPGKWKERDRGSLVAFENGTTNMYGLINVQGRGTLFFGPGIPVYKGEIVGQNCRKEDLNVNVCKAKQLSNMRSKGDGVDEHFKTPKVIGLEDALEYIADDELVEVTPKNIRMRKKTLDPIFAKKQARGIKD
ncbi:MAG TPA: translational GTPase TypA, partial [Patescibacteria group bacterium]|nr:translational GTPase TypA [Patescibacteria group bacterium]